MNTTQLFVLGAALVALSVIVGVATAYVFSGNPIVVIAAIVTFAGASHGGMWMGAVGREAVFELFEIKT